MIRIQQSLQLSGYAQRACLEIDSLLTVMGTQGSSASPVALILERVWQITLMWWCSGLTKYIYIFIFVTTNIGEKMQSWLVSQLRTASNCWNQTGYNEYKKDIVGCDWQGYLTELHVPGEANEEIEENLFLLLSLGRCLYLCNTSGTAENGLSSDAKVVLTVAKHTDIVLGKSWCCTCIRISSYQITSTIPSEDENCSNWFKLGFLRKKSWKHNSLTFWRMSSGNKVYLS